MSGKALGAAEALARTTRFQPFHRITSIKPMWLSLWDEGKRRLVTFREARLRAV